MKKIFATAFAVMLLAMSLVGCNGSNGTATPDSTTPTAQLETNAIVAPTEKATVAETEAESVADADSETPTQAISNVQNSSDTAKSDGSQKSDNGISTNQAQGSNSANGNSNAEAQQNNVSGEHDEMTDRAMYIYIGDSRLYVQLESNSSADYLLSLLKDGDIYYNADDYGDFEKVGNIGYSLPTNDTSVSTEPGDVILYHGNQICIYYGYNSWSFTRLGHISGYSESELRSALLAGYGETQIRLSLS